MDYLYKTIAYNIGNMEQGTSYIEGGMSLAVSSPTNNLAGTNPEQLIGLAWATCLNATIRSILDKQQISNESYVKVIVSLHKDQPRGLFFKLEAYGSIKDMSLDKINSYLVTAHKYCPISKLIGGNQHVSLTAEEYSLD